MAAPLFVSGSVSQGRDLRRLSSQISFSVWPQVAMSHMSAVLVTNDHDLFEVVVRRSPRDWDWKRATAREYVSRALAGEVLVGFVDEAAWDGQTDRSLADLTRAGLPLPCALRWRQRSAPEGDRGSSSGSDVLRLSDIESPCSPRLWAGLVRHFRAAMRRCVVRDLAVVDKLAWLMEEVMSATPPLRSVREFAARTGKTQRALVEWWNEA